MPAEMSPSTICGGGVMKRCLTGLIIVALAALWTVGVGAQKDTQGEAMLAAAWQKANIEGDLPAAIRQYKEIAKRRDHSIAVKALLQLAELYRTMGEADAQKIYQQIVRDYK